MSSLRSASVVSRLVRASCSAVSARKVASGAFCSAGAGGDGLAEFAFNGGEPVGGFTDPRIGCRDPLPGAGFGVAGAVAGGGGVVLGGALAAQGLLGPLIGVAGGLLGDVRARSALVTSSRSALRSSRSASRTSVRSSEKGAEPVEEGFGAIVEQVDHGGDAGVLGGLAGGCSQLLAGLAAGPARVDEVPGWVAVAVVLGQQVVAGAVATRAFAGRAPGPAGSGVARPSPHHSPAAGAFTAAGVPIAPRSGNRELPAWERYDVAVMLGLQAALNELISTRRSYDADRRPQRPR